MTHARVYLNCGETDTGSDDFAPGPCCPFVLLAAKEAEIRAGSVEVEAVEAYLHLERENERLRYSMVKLHNNINANGSLYQEAIEAVNALMLSVKSELRAALKEVEG